MLWPVGASVPWCVCVGVSVYLLVKRTVLKRQNRSRFRLRCRHVGNEGTFSRWGRDLSEERALFGGVRHLPRPTVKYVQYPALDKVWQ